MFLLVCFTEEEETTGLTHYEGIFMTIFVANALIHPIK